jgi:hypothetical protein
VLLLDLAALLSQWPFLPGTYGNVDASGKVWQVESLLAGQEHLTYPAQSLDPSFRYIPDWYVVRVDGRPYGIHFNLFTWMTYGAVRLIGPWGYNLLPLVGSLMTVLLSAWFAKRAQLVSDANLWKLVLVLGFCTPMVCYSLEPKEHSVAAAFAAGAFLLAAAGVREADGRPLRVGLTLIASGACLALASLVRGECYLLALAMGAVVVAILWRRGLGRMFAGGAAMFAGGVAVLGLWFLLNTLAWRVQVGLAHAASSTMLAFLPRIWRLMFAVEPGDRFSALLGPSVADLIGTVGGASLLVAICLGFVSGMRRSWLRHLATAFLLAGLGVVFVSSRLEGLLVVCPLVLLMMFLVRGGNLAASPTVRLVLGISVLFLILCWFLLPHAGASQFGPRFLLPLIGPLTVVAFGMIETRMAARDNRWLRVMLLLVLLSAFSSEVKGVVQNRRGASISKVLEDRLAATPAPIIVWDRRNLLVYHAPGILLGTPVMQAGSEQDLTEILQVLRKNDIHAFSLVCMEEKADECLRRLETLGLNVLEKRDLPYHGRVIVAVFGGAVPAPGR